MHRARSLTTNPTRKSGEAEELAERAQHDDAGGQLRQRQQRYIGADVGKGFIDNQPPAGRRPGLRETGEFRARDRAAIGIIGIDQDDGLKLAACGIRQCGEFVHLGAGVVPGRSMRAIGRRQDADAAGADHARQQPDRDLAAGNRHDRGIRRQPVGLRGGRRQLRYLLRQGQPLIAGGAISGTGQGMGLIPVDKSIHGRGAAG